ncbi:MAG TPA: DNA polymerase III subunit beta [Symbiobacteriaceae bacterium]|nr:DNA polymerase III subunit beta [Symbiobacteriaceae bacterium]
MEFTISQDSFAEALRTAGRAVAGRSTIPALSGMLLEAQGQELRIRATDLEVEITCRAPARVRTEGAAVLPARYLSELVRRLPPGPVSVRVAPENAVARLVWEESESVIHGFPADQFPAAGAWTDETAALEIEGAALSTLLRETGFATAHDESRPWFTGVFLTVKGETAVAMATDSAVIAYSEARVHNPADLAFSVILPGRALQELGRLLPAAGLCRVLPSHNRFRFAAGDVELTTRLLEGQYPDFRKYLPAAFPSAVTLSRERFLAACERAALAADQNGIRLEAGPDGLKVTSRTPEVGAVTERLPADLLGNPFAIPLNVHFVLNGLRSMNGADLLVEYAGPRTAVRFRAGGGARSYFAVMPLLSF